MSIFDYLDEDYFKLQDFLSVLTDSLPKLELSHIKDSETLIKCLVEQNKAYGQKIIGLFESLDSFYKTNSLMEPPESNHNQSINNNNPPTSPNFTSRLNKKVSDYEDIIKKLTTENEEFSSQIRNLSKQIESIHSKYNQPNSLQPTQSLGLGGKKDVKSFNSSMDTSSPLQIRNLFSTQQMKGSSTNYSTSNIQNNNEMAHEVDNLFFQAEYSKACEILANLEYKKPTGITFERYNNWLVVANRIKDFQINEIYNKLKIVISFTDSQGENIYNNGNNPNLDADADIDPQFINKDFQSPRIENGTRTNGNQQSTFDKINKILDEKIPKMILKNEYYYQNNVVPNITGSNNKSANIHDDGISLRGGITQRQEGGFDNSPIATTKRQQENYINEEMHMTANFNSSPSMYEENYNLEQHKMKIRYLNNQLINFEKQLEEKSIECEILKDRLQNLNNNSNNRSIQQTMLNENPIELEEIKKVLDKEQELRKDYEDKLKELIERYDEMVKSSDLKDLLLEELTQEKEGSSKLIEDLVKKKWNFYVKLNFRIKKI